jgi:hypothetical protein
MPLRHAIRSGLAITLALLGAAAASAHDLPVRKPGHWRITTIAATLGMSTIDACIRPGDSIAATTSPGRCAAPQIQRADDQVIVNVVCATSEGRETTSSLFTGDFTTWYRGIVKMSFDPPTQGRANIGVTLDAKYVGPC